jgi:tetraacyldisaccharide 4'-kinase
MPAGMDPAWQERLWKPAAELTWAGAALRSPLGLLAAAYGLVVQARAAAYQKDWLRSRRLPVPVAVVGNLTVGGSGKTPLARWLAERLLAEGCRPVLLSRGYAADQRGPVTVASAGAGPLASAEAVGDEPYWLAQNLPGVPVLIGPDRFQVGARAVREFGATHLVLDDGFQHLQLFRDADVVVLDGRRRWDREALLPRGRLREPWSALARASVLVVNKVARPEPDLLAWLRRWNRNAGVFFAHYFPAGLFSLDQEPVSDAGSALAFAGLAEPQYFFELLRGQAEIKDQVVFPDHYRFTPADLQDLERRAERAGARRLITTEKDAVRLAGLALPNLPVQVLKIGLDFFGREAECYAAIRARLENAAPAPARDPS